MRNATVLTQKTQNILTFRTVRYLQTTKKCVNCQEIVLLVPGADLLGGGGVRGKVKPLLESL